MVPDWIERSEKDYKALGTFQTEWGSLRWDRIVSDKTEWSQKGKNSSRLGRKI